MNTENNYAQNEATMLDGSNNEVSNENVSTQPNVIEEGGGWKKVAMGAGSGILLGSVATLLTSSAIAKSAEEVEVEAEAETKEEEQAETNHPAYVDDTIAIATSVNDDMSFSEAFAVARNEVGTGGAFEWRGNVYSTFTANEWDNMTVQQHAEYGSHFNWAAHEGTNNYMEHHSHHTNDAEVVSHESDVDDANVHNTSVDVSSDDVSVVIPVEPYEPEVEVLGVVHDNATGVNIGGMIIDGQEVLLFDVDGEHSFDVAASDLNHDGELQEDEVADISQSGVTVEDLGGITDYVGDLFAGNEDDPIEDGMYEA